VTVGQQISCGLFLSLAVVVSASVQSGSTAPTVETILVRMAQARAENRARLRPYVVTRDYTLFGKERNNSKAQVTAEVTFVPPNSKQFSIQQSSGSGMGERLVRRMLEGETEVVEDYGLTDISPDNYDFRFAGEGTVNNQLCYVLELLPKRKQKTLLRGNVWVDANSYLLHRMEGEPAKSPSWWLRNVRIAFSYGDVAGMWLQTASEFTTNVRIFGQYTMTSHDVRYETAELTGAGLLGPRTLLQSNNEEGPHGRPPPSVSVSLKRIQPAGREYQDGTK
jgi:Outer membrane lipoprotein-sorting protein